MNLQCACTLSHFMLGRLASRSSRMSLLHSLGVYADVVQLEKVFFSRASEQKRNGFLVACWVLQGMAGPYAYSSFHDY